MKFKQRLCTCPHTPKHHKSSGRCRKGCHCRYAARRQARKLVSRKIKMAGDAR